jgi:hypothetical protein
MDPLVKVREYQEKGILPEKIVSLIKKRFPIVIEGLNRI